MSEEQSKDEKALTDIASAEEEPPAETTGKPAMGSASGSSKASVQSQDDAEIAADPAAKTSAEGLADTPPSRAADSPAGAAESDAPAVNLEREAKLKAAAEARAARAAAKAKAEADAAAEAAPQEAKPPSPRQPELERIVALLQQHVGADAVEEAYVNELNGDMPTIIVSKAHWLNAAQLLKEHEELYFTYLRNVSGVDYETHLEVVYYLVSLQSKRDVAVKVKTEREAATVPSATPVWATANWNEREIFDLLGIDFPGHPDMRRIMMPDDWVGHPLRKDYEPLDSEV